MTTVFRRPRCVPAEHPHDERSLVALPLGRVPEPGEPQSLLPAGGEDVGMIEHGLARLWFPDVTPVAAWSAMSFFGLVGAVGGGLPFAIASGDLTAALCAVVGGLVGATYGICWAAWR